MSKTYTKKFHIIYKITRFDGAFYIGMHSTDNLDDGYFGSGNRISRSLKYHGIHQHTKEILEFLPSRKELVEREKQIVNETLLADPLCLNLCTGGGYVARAPDHPDANKNRAEGVRRFYASEKSVLARQKISQANKGRKASDEAKRNMSAAAKKRMQEQKESGLWEKVKLKNAEAHRGKPQSDETKKKRVASRKANLNGRKITFSAQARLNISKSLIGSARNVKKWKIISIIDGSFFIIENRAKWLRENNFAGRVNTIRDQTGIIVYKIERA
jgi:hypothetical protein